MAVSLSKGTKVSLTKASAENPATPKDATGAPTPLTAVLLGLGWDPDKSNGKDFDLDASVVVRKPAGSELIFFNNLKSSNGAVEHTGDNITGEGGGDDEQVKVDLTNVPADVTELDFLVNIYDAEARQQDFSKVSNAFIRVVNPNGDVELARYNLSEAGSSVAMRFGKLVRNGSDWEFVADSEPVTDYEQYVKNAGVDI